MTLDEAIKLEEEVAEINQTIAYNTDDDNWMDIAQCEKCAEEHRQLAEWLKELKRLRDQTRWIPVSERLPEPQHNGDKDFSDWLLITINLGKDSGTYTCEAYYCFSEQKWYTKRLVIGKVIAWMPLQNPYKVEEEDVE